MLRVLLFFITAGLYLTFVYGSCKKSSGCLGTHNGYLFSMDGRLFPNSDSIRINDTLWLEIRGSVLMMDNLSGQIVNYTNAANLSTVVALIELIGNTNNKGAWNDFKYLCKKWFTWFSYFRPN